jgi:hypothetical protein
LAWAFSLFVVRDDSSQILALANRYEKSPRRNARLAFAFRTTAQNPRPNRRKAA